MEIGVRELKAKLSQHLALAGAGQRIVVTDRGTPIAELGPLSTSSEIDRGIDEGWIEAPRSNGLGDALLFESEETTIDLLDRDRGD